MTLTSRLTASFAVLLALFAFPTAEAEAQAAAQETAPYGFRVIAGTLTDWNVAGRGVVRIHFACIAEDGRQVWSEDDHLLVPAGLSIKRPDGDTIYISAKLYRFGENRTILVHDTAEDADRAGRASSTKRVGLQNVPVNGCNLRYGADAGWIEIPTTVAESSDFLVLESYRLNDQRIEMNFEGVRSFSR